MSKTNDRSMGNDEIRVPCETCGHSKMVHDGTGMDGPCHAYTCKRDKKCPRFVPGPLKL